MVSFKRRRSGTEQGKRIFHLCSDDGHIASVIARRFFLLVAGFLLLIDDDESNIFKRGENRGACADDYAGFPMAHSPLGLRLFDVTQRGVQYHNAFELRSKPCPALAPKPKR